MAETKKQSKSSDDIKKEKDEKYITNLTKNAYQNGLVAGQQEVYTVISDFLSQRMVEHFELKKDELAKELREIYLLVKQNIKQKS